MIQFGANRRRESTAAAQEIANHRSGWIFAASRWERAEVNNLLPIAAVTATLSSLLSDNLKLDPEIADATLTAKPPDKVRSGDQTGNNLNLFLYHVERNATWNNTPLPTTPWSNGRPPLALNLHYLLTAYGREDDDIQAHQLLGWAMRTLSEHPLLKQADIQNPLRITLEPMTLDEMSKLWSALQTQYRISVAFQVSPILL